MTIDMWYGDKTSKATKVDIYWSDLDCKYHGNIYIDGLVVGDYVAESTKEVEDAFPQLNFNFDL